MARRLTQWVWLGHLAVGVLLIAAVQSTEGIFSSALYDVVAASSVVAIAIGVRWHKPRFQRGWTLLCIGFELFWIGDMIFTGYDVLGHEAPFPSIADPFYLAAYAFLGSGLITFARARGATRDTLLDSLVVSAGLAVLGWLAIIEPLAGSARDDFLPWLVSVAYPAGSLVLLVTSLRLLLAGGDAGTVSARLLFAAMAAQLLADSVYAHLTTKGGYSEGHPVDILWLIAYVCAGAAALHPSMRGVVSRLPRVANPLSRPRFTVLMTATLMVPVADATFSIRPDYLAAVVSAFLVALVAVRLIGPVDALARSVSLDPLTGLANRRLMVERLDKILNPDKADRDVALMFCDLDNFKVVNDALGHAAGDGLLVAIAHRIRGVVRATDTVARFGGDEFVVLVEYSDEENTALVAERIRSAVAEPLTLPDGTVVTPTLSIGLATAKAREVTGEELMRRADAAMYRAKELGRARVECYVPELQDEVRERLRLQGELPTAIETGELDCLYQPEILLATNEVFGFESLVRWHHPQLGLLAPDRFVAIAESTGCVDAMFRAVLRRTLSAQAAWSRMVGFAPTVAVNLSPHQLTDRTLVSTVAAALEEAGASPTTLWIEVTESAVADAAKLAVSLAGLKALGVRLAVDDFGTGWSSLDRLSRFPWDAIKIDKSFTERLGNDERARQAVVATVAMAHAFGAVAVAEGVETDLQRRALTDLGCDVAQGYLFSRPVDATTAGYMVDPRRRFTPAVPTGPIGVVPAAG